MGINKKTAKKVVSAILEGYDFNYIISQPDYDLINFHIESEHNNKIELQLDFCDGKKRIGISIYTRSEDLVELGYYYSESKKFERVEKFWELLFISGLKF